MEDYIKICTEDTLVKWFLKISQDKSWNYLTFELPSGKEIKGKDQDSNYIIYIDTKNNIVVDVEGLESLIRQEFGLSTVSSNGSWLEKLELLNS